MKNTAIQEGSYGSFTEDEIIAGISDSNSLAYIHNTGVN